MILKTTTNTCKNQKFTRKVREESVEAIKTITVSLKILSIYNDSLDVFYNPIATVNITIMRQDFKKKPKIQKKYKIKKKNLKARGIEVKKTNG